MNTNAFDGMGKYTNNSDSIFVDIAAVDYNIQASYGPNTLTNPFVNGPVDYTTSLEANQIGFGPDQRALQSTQSTAGLTRAAANVNKTQPMIGYDRTGMPLPSRALFSTSNISQFN